MVLEERSGAKKLLKLLLEGIDTINTNVKTNTVEIKDVQRMLVEHKELLILLVKQLELVSGDEL